MSVLPALLVWFAPLLLGSGVWVACTGLPRRGAEYAIAFGGGWILGALLCGLLTRVLSGDDLSGTLQQTGTGAVLLGLGGWVFAWWLRERWIASQPAPGPPAHRLLIVIVLVLLGARCWVIAQDILLRPTLPWDAWAVWQAKAKAWVLAGHATPYVSFNKWLLQPQVDVRTAGAWTYPELLPWTTVWFASNAGWIEPWINLAWLGLWLGLLFAQYGQWRMLGLHAAPALVGIYLLGSLPLLDAHAALGGYADLWLAVVLSLGAHAWLRWRCHGERRQLLIVIIVIALLPMLKLEGSVWSILLGAACVFGALPARMKRRRFLIGAAVAAVAIALSIASGVAWVGVVRRYVESGLVFDTTQLGDSLAALANALWGQWNWNLLWFVLPVALCWNWKTWSRSPIARRVATLVAVPVLLIFGLFTFTTASRYAQSYSAVNRLLLQLTPMLISLLVFALRPPDVAPVAAQAGNQDSEREPEAIASA
jgi:hypothetical protein